VCNHRQCVANVYQRPSETSSDTKLIAGLDNILTRRISIFLIQIGQLQSAARVRVICV
jgi:hypothetical protein